MNRFMEDVKIGTVTWKGAGRDHDGVGKEPVLLLELRVNKPIASPKQEYQHEYSPRYGKSC